MNGVVEAANKAIKKILVKKTDTYKYWHEYLPFSLCAYCISIRTSTGATLYSLVYGIKVVLPAEVEIPSLRILSLIELSEAVLGFRSLGSLSILIRSLHLLMMLCHTSLGHLSSGFLILGLHPLSLLRLPIFSLG